MLANLERMTTFDLRSLPRGPSQNVVLLKLSWAWLR